MFKRKIAQEAVKATVSNKKLIGVMVGAYAVYFGIQYFVTRQGTKAGVVAAHKKMDKEKKDES
jgi:hypothetical protein